MLKRIVLQTALVGVCALMIGVAGCHKSDPPPAAPIAPGAARTIPKNMLDAVDHLPPDQRQRALESMQKGAGIQPDAGGSTSGKQ
jgi:hypothetical protein